jgi:hypothetical protein
MVHGVWFSLALAVLGIEPLLGGAGAKAFSANPSCPCLMMDSHPGAVGGFDITFDNEGNSSMCTLSNTYTYPADYGLNDCNTWDQGLAPFCNSSGTGSSGTLCDRPWCYVDPDACFESSSVLAYYKSSICKGDGLSLYYSYDTCSPDNNAFQHRRLKKVTDVLRGKHLRVVVPALENPMFMVVDSNDESASCCSYADRSCCYPLSTGVSITNRTYLNTLNGKAVAGVHVELLQLMAARAGFTYSFQSISEGSRVQAKGQVFTAGVYDIFQGLADLQATRVWPTQNRTEYAQFAAPIYDDQQLLVVRVRSKAMTLSDQAQLVFLPFSFELWLVILVVTFCMAIAYAYFLEDGKYLPRLSASRTIWARLLVYVKMLTVSWHRAMLELLSANPYYSEHHNIDSSARRFKGTHRGPHKILTLGWGFFIVITLAAYTANLASLLTIREMVTGTYASLEDCIQAKCRICVPQGEYSAGSPHPKP